MTSFIDFPYAGPDVSFEADDDGPDSDAVEVTMLIVPPPVLETDSEEAEIELVLLKIC